jgi:hypothetical protein
MNRPNNLEHLPLVSNQAKSNIGSQNQAFASEGNAQKLPYLGRLWPYKTYKTRDGRLARVKRSSLRGQFISFDKTVLKHFETQS